MKGRILTNALLEKFREHLILEERSEATIEKYCRDVSAFTAYADDAEITKELVIAYKNKLKDDGYAVRSINSIISSLSECFCFATILYHESRKQATPFSRFLPVFFLFLLPLNATAPVIREASRMTEGVCLHYERMPDLSRHPFYHIR